jgi:hypothetical protein
VLPALAYNVVMTETRITNRHSASAPTRPLPRGSGWLVLLVVVPFAVAACGSGSTAPEVANLGATTSTTTSSAASGTSLDKLAACMRSHGITQFPDPTNGGKTLRLQVGPGQALDPSSPRYQSAQAACARLAPSGFLGVGEQTITPADQLDYLKAAGCVRAHGFTAFPDPTITDGHVKFVIPANIDPNAPKLQAAIATCRKLIPAGLPYSS